MKKRWYVVCDPDVSWPDMPGNPIDKRDIWTVSRKPKKPGWETDGGHNGYGLPKKLAQELADAANEKWERDHA